MFSLQLEITVFTTSRSVSIAGLITDSSLNVHGLKEVA